MGKPLSISLLYTANIRGDLALLPRLFTFLQRLKPAADMNTLLLDLGESCADSAWHCRATGGRSALIVLDGMGYHAANVAGILEPENRRKLAAQVTMGLVDVGRAWTYRAPPGRDLSIQATLEPDGPSARLQILMRPGACTRVDGNVLRLQALSAGQIGQARVTLDAPARVDFAAVHDLPPETPPNPSIAGAVEFVESEARLLRKKMSGGG